MSDGTLFIGCLAGRGKGKINEENQHGEKIRGLGWEEELRCEAVSMYNYGLPQDPCSSS